MPVPRVSDDGSTVELDLHGAQVDDAINLVRRAAQLASERGRSTLRVIHGSSTSDPLARNRTIKHALLDALEEGMDGVTSHYAMEDATLLSLNPGHRSDPTRLMLLNLR